MTIQCRSLRKPLAPLQLLFPIELARLPAAARLRARRHGRARGGGRASTRTAHTRTTAAHGPLCCPGSATDRMARLTAPAGSKLVARSAHSASDPTDATLTGGGAALTAFLLLVVVVIVVVAGTTATGLRAHMHGRLRVSAREDGVVETWRWRWSARFGVRRSWQQRWGRGG